MQKRKPLDKGPLRNGFRWCQTVIHNRHECRSDWVVTEFEPPVLLEQSLTHRCAEVSRELEGAERWEMFEKDGSTLITLSVWWVLPGVRGWLNKLAGTGQQSRGASVRRRLAYTQFEAERRSGVQS
jgi:hypothetical protein